MSNVTKTSLKTDNIIILRSVYGKVGIKYYIQPCPDPVTNQLPKCVKRVNSQGDMIMSDAERNSGEYFIKENETFIIQDGKTFDLSNPIEASQWEAIKNCRLIAPDRYAKDMNGDLLIDGTTSWRTTKPRYGVAELYIERPGEDAVRRVSRKKLYHNAIAFILDDERGSEGRLLKARILGKNMTNMPDADVEDYLFEIAEKDPQKIINLYTGDDIALRVLFIEAKDAHVINYKNKLYMFGDDKILGATDDAVIAWMKEARNKHTLDLIKKETYPDMYKEPSKK